MVAKICGLKLRWIFSFIFARKATAVNTIIETVQINIFAFLSFRCKTGFGKLSVKAVSFKFSLLLFYDYINPFKKAF